MKIIRISAKVTAAILFLALLGYLYISFTLEQRINKVYAVNPLPLEVSDDAELISKGAHLYQIKGCEDCHGADLGGKVMFEDKLVGRFTGANITYGKGGLPQNYTSEDWVRALRHGVGQDSKPLLLMPSHELYTLSDEDVQAIIAFCMRQKPVHRELPAIELGPMGKVLASTGKINLLPAEIIDHDFKPPKEVEAIASAAFGKYLSVSCSGCHQPDFKGGEAPVPGMPPIPDITGTGKPGKWSEAQFIQTLRTGTTPEGKQMRNEDMPWQMTRAYTDTELKALYLFLKSQ